jgi:hypothetical protein
MDSQKLTGARRIFDKSLHCLVALNRGEGLRHLSPTESVFFPIRGHRIPAEILR